MSWSVYLSLYKKVTFSLLIVLLIFISAELLYRLFFPHFDIPYSLSRGFISGYHQWLPEKKKDSRLLFRTNSSFIRQYPVEGYKYEFFMPKPKNTFRIFLLGGSSAAGGIYTNRGNMGDQIELRLQDAVPERTIQLINAAVEGYGTSRILRLVNEVKHYSPDLFIIYSGHNDLGERVFFRQIFNSSMQFYIWEFGAHSQLFMGIRNLLHRNFLNRRTKKFTKIKRKLQGTPYQRYKKVRLNAMKQILENSGDAFQEYKETLSAYQKHLEIIISIAHKQSIPLLLMTVVPNYLEWEPEAYVSWHYPFGKFPQNLIRLNSDFKKAIIDRNIKKARDIAIDILKFDETRADIHYKLAEIFSQFNENDKAKEQFIKAAKYDLSLIMPRTTKDFNDVIRHVAKENPSVLFVDTEALVAENSSCNVPGSKWIFDGCHPRLKTFELLSKAAIQSLVRHRIPKELSILRLGKIKSDSFYRKQLYLQPKLIEEKNIKMASNTMKLAFPRNCWAVFRNFQQATQYGHDNPYAMAGMAGIAELERAKKINMQLSSTFPDNFRNRQSKKNSISKIQKNSPIHSNYPCLSKPQRLPLNEFIMKIACSKKALHHCIKQVFSEHPYLDFIQSNILQKWLDLRSENDFISYWSKRFNENANNLTSEDGFLFLGKGWQIEFSGILKMRMKKVSFSTTRKAMIIIPATKPFKGILQLQLYADTRNINTQNSELQQYIPILTQKLITQTNEKKLSLILKNNNNLTYKSNTIHFSEGINTLILSLKENSPACPKNFIVNSIMFDNQIH